MCKRIGLRYMLKTVWDTAVTKCYSESVLPDTNKTASPPELRSLLTRLCSYLPELRERYQVKRLGIFGSFVRGEQQPDSDLDILVDFEVAPSFFEFMRLENQLQELLGHKVDLVMTRALKPNIGERILHEVVYCDGEA
jgi:predicted nucleotidyltransferase